MIKQSEIEKLIISGFDLKLISFELDIPIEQVIECQKNLEKNSKIGRNYTEIIEDMNNEAYSKLEAMRKKYRELVPEKDIAVHQKREAMTEQNAEAVELVIKTMQEKIEAMKNGTKKERRNQAGEILKLLKGIKEYDLTIEQAEKLISLIDQKELKGLNMDMIDKIDFHIDRYKTRMIEKLAKAVGIVQEQTEDTEELKALSKKLTYNMVQRNQLLVGGIKTKIDTKISHIEQQKAIEAIKNNINQSIENVIMDLANGTLDIDNANRAIEEESKERVRNKPKTIFALTEEQEKKQIIMQIRVALKEKADKYHIESPIITIEQLSNLTKGNLEQSVETVINNLITSKNYEKAKSTCDYYSNTDEKSPIFRTVKDLKKRIANAEIADLVVRVINTDMNPAEAKAFIEFMEKAFRTKGIKKESIQLGKRKDGVKNITLADIWEDEKEPLKI